MPKGKLSEQEGRAPFLFTFAFLRMRVKKDAEKACGLENYAYLCSRVFRERIWKTCDY